MLIGIHVDRKSKLRILIYESLERLGPYTEVENSIGLLGSAANTEHLKVFGHLLSF